MKRFDLVLAGSILALSISISGCATYSANISDMSTIYNKPAIAGAPKILIADINDTRPDKTKLGTVGALNISSKAPINVILTNKIAARLQDEGFNIQKIDAASLSDKGKLTEILNSSNGAMCLSGGLGNFFIASFDALMEKAKNTVTFYIKVYDKAGNTLFDKNYSVYAENWIGLTGGSGCEKLIDMSLQASVDELFKDNDFKSVLATIKKQ